MKRNVRRWRIELPAEFLTVQDPPESSKGLPGITSSAASKSATARAFVRVLLLAPQPLPASASGPQHSQIHPPARGHNPDRPRVDYQSEKIIAKGQIFDAQTVNKDLLNNSLALS